MLNWSTKKLGEIREEIKKEKAPIGAMPYIEIGNVNVESKKVNFTEKGAVKGSIFCPEGSILISRVRPTRGAVVLVNKKYAVSSAFTIIQPKINPRLLFYFLAWNKNFFEYLGNLQKGTSYPSVRESDILDFEVSFPEDKVEQQKIVYILDSIQDAIRTQEKIIEKTKELKKSLLNEIFNSKIKSQKSKFKIKRWEKLGNLCEKPEYGYTANSIKKSLGPKFLRITDIQDEKVNWENVPFCECKEVGKYLLNDRDILIARIGATTGKTFLIKNPPRAIFGSYLIRIKTKPKLFSDFLNYYFQSSHYWRQINQLKGGKLKGGLNIPILQGLRVPLPPLPEQREIAEILQTIDQKIEIEQKKKALYEELFRTMLNKLMTGEIRVDNL
ncbi:MAG: restriction endonuclease subunit S, partial [Candidatus Pacebacteria bacterium]|nr:restriction endonuclease subunit S [Candidatus Paceibacterota bacterium]